MKKTIISVVMLASVFATPVTSVFAETNNQPTITTKTTEEKKLTPLADDTKVNYTITVNLVDNDGKTLASIPTKTNDSIEKLYRTRSKSIFNTYSGYLGKEFKEGSLKFKALEIDQHVKRTNTNGVYDYVDTITVKVEPVTGEAKPADKKDETKPSEVKPLTDAKATDKKDEAKPSEVKPSTDAKATDKKDETKPSEVKPSTDTKATDKKDETKPSEVKPSTDQKVTDKKDEVKTSEVKPSTDQKVADKKNETKPSTDQKIADKKDETKPSEVKPSSDQKVADTKDETKPSTDQKVVDKKDDTKPSEVKPSAEQNRKVFVVDGDAKTYYVNKADIPSTVKPEQVKEVSEKEAKDAGKMEFVKDKQVEDKKADDKKVETPKQSEEKKVEAPKQTETKKTELPKTGDAGTLLSTVAGTMLTGVGAFFGLKRKK